MDTNTIKSKEPFVRFYNVDDVPVCVWSDGDEVQGFVVTTGYAYSPLKATTEGREIDVDQLALLV